MEKEELTPLASPESPKLNREEQLEQNFPAPDTSCPVSSFQLAYCFEGAQNAAQNAWGARCLLENSIYLMVIGYGSQK